MKQTLYTIYTERLHPAQVEKMVSYHVSGATFLYGTGCWHSQLEDALIISILSSDPTMPDTVHRIAETIKTINKQQSVLVTSAPVESELL